MQVPADAQPEIKKRAMNEVTRPPQARHPALAYAPSSRLSVAGQMVHLRNVSAVTDRTTHSSFAAFHEPRGEPQSPAQRSFHLRLGITSYLRTVVSRPDSQRTAARFQWVVCTNGQPLLRWHLEQWPKSVSAEQERQEEAIADEATGSQPSAPSARLAPAASRHAKQPQWATKSSKHTHRRRTASERPRRRSSRSRSARNRKRTSRTDVRHPRTSQRASGPALESLTEQNSATLRPCSYGQRAAEPSTGEASKHAEGQARTGAGARIAVPITRRGRN